MTLVFKSRFWESLSKEPVSFMRAPADYLFPTWWTSYPLRTSHLRAWQGGPLAQMMTKWSQEKKLRTALQTLSYLTGKTTSFLHKHLDSYYHHDWSADPFSLGAYSYEGISDKNRRQNHFENFLWLSGEAQVSGGDRGTVHGALNHGHETALKVIKHLSRRS